MERTENTETLGLSAQEILTQMSNYQQVLLLAREMGADTITIHMSSLNK